MGSTNPSFMNGVPELLILRLLRSGEMYGYEIVQAIQDQTDAVVVLGEGVIYPVLHALQHAGALTSRRKTVNGRSRIYYTLTPTGVTRLGELAATWMRLTHAVQQVFAGGENAQAI